MIVVMGGSGSGKSAYAEKLAVSRNKEPRYYLATMQVYDDEGEKKVARHRKLRRGKGFTTLERPVDICASLPREKGTVLLECMSNLVANEMFREEWGDEPVDAARADSVGKKIVTEIAELNRQSSELILVTNNVFEDGICYDEGTMEYLRTMGNVNTRLCKMADAVIEVVVGIPVLLKGESHIILENEEEC